MGLHGLQYGRLASKRGFVGVAAVALYGMTVPWGASKRSNSSAAKVKRPAPATADLTDDHHEAVRVADGNKFR
jgi:hypothetical protein